MPLIYLDVCCLCRPFDSQTQERVRLESEAVLSIIEQCQSRRQWQLLSSQIIKFEVFKMPDHDHRNRVRLALEKACLNVQLTTEVEARAVELQEMGFKAYDSLHVACAEIGFADVMLTTDDRLLKRAKRFRSELSVRIENPVIWLMEILGNEET